MPNRRHSLALIVSSLILPGVVLSPAEAGGGRSQTEKLIYRRRDERKAEKAEEERQQKAEEQRNQREAEESA